MLGPSNMLGIHLLRGDALNLDVRIVVIKQSKLNARSPLALKASRHNWQTDDRQGAIFKALYELYSSNCQIPVVTSEGYPKFMYTRVYHKTPFLEISLLKVVSWSWGPWKQMSEMHFSKICLLPEGK